MSATTLWSALALARSSAVHTTPEWVPLSRLAGRTLAEAVVAKADVPPGDVAAMDGWAVGSGPGPWRIAGESAAGSPWHGRLAPDEAVRISTGALLPAGGYGVLRLENALEGAELRAFGRPEAGKDVRRRGEDLLAGRAVLNAGVRLTAPEVGVVAACGRAGAHCWARPSVAIVATGSELVDPGEEPSLGTIYDSNRYGLGAQVENAGARVVHSERVSDDLATLRQALNEIAEGALEYDLLVIAGGVSIGRHDHVRRALSDAGAEVVVDSIALRPGRPTLIGRQGRLRVLGLPGNPAAAAMVFHLIGGALLGAEAPWTRLPLAEPWCSKVGVDELLRCAERGGRAMPRSAQGAGSITSLAGSDCVAWLPRGRRRFERGDEVLVSRLR